jgi:hypothetical protein
MKVNIDQTVQITDEQRVQMANVLDGRITRRQATRDEMKDYIWSAGKGWENELNEDFLGLSGDDTTVDETADDEDLLGDDEDLLGDSVEDADDIDDLI